MKRALCRPAPAAMVARSYLRTLCGAIALVLSATPSLWADSMTLATSQSAQGSNDAVSWSQLGSNATLLPMSFNANSNGGTTVSVGLKGPNSMLSVVCPASACSWSGAGMASGQSLIWTSNGTNGGNGPITLSFSRGQSGIGALVQADGPSQFTATIETFSGSTSLGSFSQTSDSKGTAIYVGVVDQSGLNITSVVISMLGTQGVASDFAIDSLMLGSSVGSPVNPPPVPTITTTRTSTATPTPIPTATPHATPTAPPSNPGITFVGAGPLFDSSTAVTTVTVGLPAGVQSGDVLLAQVVVADGNGTVVPTLPSGWTNIRHDSVNNGNKETSWLYYKVAGASEPASYGWNINPNWAAGVMGAWRGTSSAPIDNASGATGSGSSQASVSAPSLIPGNSSELQVYFYGSQAFAGPTITLSNSLTQRFDVKSSKEGFTLAFADLAAPSANNPSASYPASASIPGTVVISGQAVLLIPGSAGAPPPPPPPSPIPTVPPTAIKTPTVVATPTAPAISFIGAGPLTDNSNAVTSVNVGLPTGVHSGDVLVAQIVVADGKASIVPTLPSGWTAIRHDAISNGNNITSWLYYKVASASEPGSYGWNISPNWAAGVIGAWRGASASPVDKNSGATAAGTSPKSSAAPSLIPALNGELQLYFYAAQSFAAPTIAEPGSIAQRFNTRSGKEGFTLAFGDLAAPIAGNASPTYSAIATIGGSLATTAQAVLLKPGP